MTLLSTAGVFPATQNAPPLSEPLFRALRDFIYKKTGIYFQDKKQYLLEGRISKRLHLLGLTSYEEYLELLKYSPSREQELRFLYDVVTINETFFFRNGSQLEVIEQSLIPEMVAAKGAAGSTSLRIWSAACSTGEEPYSMALVYLEKLKPRFPHLRLEIVGTDISNSVLSRARRGIYSEYSVRNTPKEYLEKYFEKHEGHFQLREHVKELVSFQHLNLYDRGEVHTMKPFDIVLCCNVMIYFDTLSKVQVVADLHKNLRIGGYLFLGYSEVLHGISSAFRVINFPKTVGYKKE